MSLDSLRLTVRDTENAVTVTISAVRLPPGEEASRLQVFIVAGECLSPRGEKSREASKNKTTTAKKKKINKRIRRFRYLFSSRPLGNHRAKVSAVHFSREIMEYRTTRFCTLTTDVTAGLVLPIYFTIDNVDSAAVLPHFYTETVLL